ncbi:MAG: nucleotidyltransferase domain-containing protein [Nitrospiraceae bacterium]|nr:MAG: nucleotidyltransferase domain-containing protein [Nitrospiraceae bacterium]
MQTNCDIKRIITYFKSRKEVSALYLFGSCAEGRELPESDLDIAVLIDEKKLQRKNFEQLKNIYYKASPSFSLRQVDITVLNIASPYLNHRVIKTGKMLFDRNRKLRVRFMTDAIIEYLDFKPIEDIFNKSVASRFRNKSLSTVTH